jgi:hypothetical protein
MNNATSLSQHKSALSDSDCSYRQAKSVGKAPKKMTKAEMERENQLANEAWEAIVKSMNEPLPAEAVNVSASNISKEERPRAQDGLVQVDQGSLIGNGASAMDKVLNQVAPHAIGSRLSPQCV